MNTRKSDLAAVILFCGFLFAMALCYVLLPKKDFSEYEKRYLADAPKADWQAVSSGSWGSEAETYLADHMPGRNFFVGLNAYTDLLMGRFNTGDVRLLDGRLAEAPNTLDDTALDKNFRAIHNFAETLGQPVDLMIVPSAGWAAGAAGYEDDSIIKTIYSRAGDLNTVDLLSVFRNRPELYYKTDHHWTSAGAHAGYAAYMQHLGRDFRPASDFQKQTFDGFRGSTYSRSALWLTPAESLELWTGCDGITVVNSEAKTPHEGLFYPERLAEADKYTVFLDGNHSVVRITNPEGSGKLLVIRDSYSNSLGCFLAQSFGEVVLVDLRYSKSPVSQLAQEGFDHVLICYSIGNFLTDANIVWLR